MTHVASVSPARAPWAVHTRGELDALAAAWSRLGAAFSTPAAGGVIDPERLILATARAAPDDERLFVVAATWLAQHHAFMNGRRLTALAATLRSADDMETSAVLGALLSWADDLAGRGAPFAAVRARCRPIAPPRPLFRVVRMLPAFAADAATRALPLFGAWGLWHDDAQPKPEAIRPTGWLLRHAPELRLRAVIGPLLEADVLTMVLVGSPGVGVGIAPEVTVRDVARAYQASYAATHESAEQLVRRGLLVRERHGTRQVLRPTPWARTLVA